MTNREKIEQMSGEDLAALIAEGMGWKTGYDGIVKYWIDNDGNDIYVWDPIENWDQAILIVAAHFKISLVPPGVYHKENRWTAENPEDFRYYDNDPRKAICRCAGLISLEERDANKS